jgi:hypothetical protein
MDAPGATVEPEMASMVPPTVPVPPRVAPLATVTVPPAELWLPLIKRVPSLTAVVPV